MELPDGGDYTMDHSAVVFVLDEAAHIVAIFTCPSMWHRSAPTCARAPQARRARCHMSTSETDSASARAFVALQYLLPQHLLSGLVHELTRSRVRWLKNALIGGFLERFPSRPGMSAAQPDPFAFESFNAFFTRALRTDARPADPDPSAIVSPVDGSVSQLGRLNGSWLVQAKGHAYTLESLLGADGAWAEAFRGGAFVTLYLAPFNYHRIHMPLTGSARRVVPPGATVQCECHDPRLRAGPLCAQREPPCVFAPGRSPSPCWSVRSSSAAWSPSGTARSRRGGRGDAPSCRR